MSLPTWPDQLIMDAMPKRGDPRRLAYTPEFDALVAKLQGLSPAITHRDVYLRMVALHNNGGRPLFDVDDQ